MEKEVEQLMAKEIRALGQESIPEARWMRDVGAGECLLSAARSLQSMWLGWWDLILLGGLRRLRVSFQPGP